MASATRTPRPPFTPGEEVFGIFADVPENVPADKAQHCTGGTSGAYGPVVSCVQHEDGERWVLTADLYGRERTYTLSRTGASDFVDRPLFTAAQRAEQATADAARTAAWKARTA